MTVFERDGKNEIMIRNWLKAIATPDGDEYDIVWYELHHGKWVKMGRQERWTKKRFDEDFERDEGW